MPEGLSGRFGNLDAALPQGGDQRLQVARIRRPFRHLAAYHPVALLGRVIGWWGRPALYSPGIQRMAGTIFWLVTVCIFALPFFLFGKYAPWLAFLIGAPFLL